MIFTHCYPFSFPICRRSPLDKRPLIDQFLPVLDPPLDGVCRNTLTQVGAMMTILIKFSKHPSSGSEAKADCHYVFHYLRLRWAKRSHHIKEGNPLRVHVKIWRLWKKKFQLCVINISMEVDLLKYSHTSHERANIVNLFQWHDGQHCCETDKEGNF